MDTAPTLLEVERPVPSVRDQLSSTEQSLSMDMSLHFAILSVAVDPDPDSSMKSPPALNLEDPEITMVWPPFPEWDDLADTDSLLLDVESLCDNITDFVISDSDDPDINEIL